MLLRRRNSESDQCSGTNERTRIRRKGIKSDKKKSCSKKGIVRHPKAQHKSLGHGFKVLTRGEAGFTYQLWSDFTKWSVESKEKSS